MEERKIRSSPTTLVAVVQVALVILSYANICDCLPLLREEQRRIDADNVFHLNKTDAVGVGISKGESASFEGVLNQNGGAFSMSMVFGDDDSIPDGATAVPTPSPVIISESPSTSPSRAPTITTTRGIPPGGSCAGTDENGNFGEATDNELTVAYQYELELNTDLDATEASTTVLPDLENAIADLLLPILGDCITERGARLLQESNGTQTISAGAISRLPDDIVQVGASCSAIGGGGTPCFVTSGELSLFYAEPLTVAEEDAERDVALEFIKSNVNGDNFNASAVNPNIQQVLILDSPDADPASGSDTQSVGDSGGGRNSIIPILAATGGFLLLLLALLCARRAWKKNQEDEDKEFDEEVQGEEAEGSRDPGMDDRDGDGGSDLSPVNEEDAFLFSGSQEESF